MKTYEQNISEAIEKASYRLASLATKAERKGDIKRATELRSRIETLKAA